MTMAADTLKSGSGADAATQAYYERNAEDYFAATVQADLTQLYERFLAYVPPGGHILDAGSGSGRDTLAFLKRGFAVDAFDASPSLARLSAELTGIQTQVLRLEDFNETGRYDGVWACASLLHLRKQELPDTVAALARALKPGGALYMSFKYGHDERMASDGRFFTDLDEPALAAIIAAVPLLRQKEMWTTGGEDTFKGRGTWINAIAIRETDA